MTLPVTFPRIAETSPEEVRMPAVPRLSSFALFQGARLVVIEHEGSEYRLQITGRGKLILTR